MSAVPESFLGRAANDADAQETREWLDALQAVIATEGEERAHYLLERLIEEARQAGIDKAVDILLEFRSFLDCFHIDHVRAFTTAALRNASPATARGVHRTLPLPIAVNARQSPRSDRLGVAPCRIAIVARSAPTVRRALG